MAPKFWSASACAATIVNVSMLTKTSAHTGSSRNTSPLGRRESDNRLPRSVCNHSSMSPRLRGWLVLAVSCWLWPPIIAWAQPTLASAPSGREPRVVVAPFVNLSLQVDDEWIGVGVAESVAADLIQSGAFGGAQVLTASPPESGAPPDEAAQRAAAEGLGAVWLVNGAYQRVGSVLRVTGRVVDVATGAIRHTAMIDGRLEDLFDLQDQMAEALRGGLAGIPATRPADRPGPARGPGATRDVGATAGAVTGVTGTVELGGASSAAAVRPPIPASITNKASTVMRLRRLRFFTCGSAISGRPAKLDDGDREKQHHQHPGNREIAAETALMQFGHSHWEAPLSAINNTKIMNR
ncbi:MAG TPA: hypothetical protein EYQ83_11610 [Acidobacteria bacterium]|nr:hypothetical protein [Acidobacteriota bacterium]